MTFGWAKSTLGRDIARRYAAGESIRALCGLLGDLGHAVGHGSLRSWLKRKGVSRGSVVPDDWTPPAQIAAAIVKAGGQSASRNGVTSWCFRNGVSLASAKAKRNGASRLDHGRPQDHKQPSVKPRKLADVAGGATIITRRRDGCAFLGGGHEPATQDTPCCNAPVVPGTSWCATHRAAVFAGHKDVAA
jgi:hypothetical protein